MLPIPLLPVTGRLCIINSARCQPDRPCTGANTGTGSGKVSTFIGRWDAGGRVKVGNPDSVAYPIMAGAVTTATLKGPLMTSINNAMKSLVRAQQKTRTAMCGAERCETPPDVLITAEM